jgi:pyruvate ferredoxin oxidoreductase gamma subunit
MLRVCFHGRGGHGIKTASRILGTAAFLSGLEAQDSPIYGAERRGAAVAAFTRIAPESICERGSIIDPDLILVADETLFADPTAGVLTGCELASAIFVNSSLESSFLAKQYAIRGCVITRDLTGLTMGLLGGGSALSAALGSAACALIGLKPVDIVVRAVREELAELRLPQEVMEKNFQVARRAYSSLAAISIRDRRARESHLQVNGSCLISPPTYIAGPEGVPIIYASGNSAARHTGSWRVFRPVIDLSACTHCGICFALCPDGAITLDESARPIIDYENCKGCMICYQECPIHCIDEQKEVRAW